MRISYNDVSLIVRVLSSTTMGTFVLTTYDTTGQVTGVNNAFITDSGCLITVDVDA